MMQMNVVVILMKNNMILSGYSMAGNFHQEFNFAAFVKAIFLIININYTPD